MKTYKREIATAMFVYLALMFVVALDSDRALEIAKFLSLPIFGFGGGAFALDWQSKQNS